ncbi:hypothetical protein [Deinococcus sp.]
MAPTSHQLTERGRVLEGVLREVLAWSRAYVPPGQAVCEAGSAER